MNTKDGLTEEAAFNLATQLTEADNTVDFAKTPDGLYHVNWIKNKKFISYTGDEHTDEVWTKADGTMIAIQDLDLPHAKNIIRMMLRNERKREELTTDMINALADYRFGEDGAGNNTIH